MNSRIAEIGKRCEAATPDIFQIMKHVQQSDKSGCDCDLCLLILDKIEKKVQSATKNLLSEVQRLQKELEEARGR